MFTKILTCTDGSVNALKAAGEAAQLAKQTNACILLLHVVEKPEAALTPELSYSVPWQLEHIVTALEHEPIDKHRSILQNTEAIFCQAGVKYQPLQANGHPATEIVNVAEREEVDLIVLGSWGFNPLKSDCLGNVADEVALHASCSILIVR